MIIEILVIVVIIGIGFVALGYFLSLQLQMFRGEKQVIQVDLANKQRSIEQLVESIQRDLQSRQQEIRALEQDRVKKFAELSSTLESHRQLTQQLQVSTQQLATVLSNNQARGGWGERILEDLMRSNGLVEGVHYAKQLSQVGGLRPDVTLLLPNQRTVPIDVKFPYSEIQKMASTESRAAKDQHVRQFVSDVKSKINKVAEYIRPDKETLDYAILFVPNEMIFSFINQNFPELVDEAMSKRVLIVSPFTFLIVARTILESYRNFMIEDKLRDIVGIVGEFRQEWNKYNEEFKKFGRSIETLRSGYETLSTTRTNQMERKILKIEEYQGGQLLESGPTSRVSTGRKTSDREQLPLPTPGA
jgi:DNA recombination protein RmuC